MMSTALTGTVVRTAIYDATDTNWGQCCADSADVNAYVAEAKSGTPRIYQMVIGTGALSGAPWPLTTASFPVGVALSADDSTLYVLLDNGDVYSTPVSSPSLTKLPATFNSLDGFTSAWSGLLLDPIFPWRLLAWNRTARKIYVCDLQSQQATYYSVPGGTHFVVGIGKYNPDPNIFLVMLQAPATAGLGMGGDILLKWYRKQHRWETVAGNFTTANGASGGAANVTGLAAQGTNCCSFAADPDGRVYLAKDTLTFSKVENGILTDLTTSLAFAPKSCVWYLPTLNQALLRITGRVVVMS